MEVRTNRRRKVEHYVESRHLKLEDLKVNARDVCNQYLYKENIPAFPRPEFHVSHLKHDTDRAGLQGIVTDGGFKIPSNELRKLLWWSLAVKAEDVASAETRLLEENFPGRTEEQAQRQQPFLDKFTTSPAFLETSMLGSFRFTFALERVLKAYSEQFCSGAQPVMRVFETVLYKQQVMYVVLVHDPETPDQELFSEFPPLADEPNAVCVYRDGRFIWRPEAMCETHNYELIQRPDENLMEVRGMWNPQFYVWDHVALTLHMKDEQVLQFGSDQLRENLSFCEKGGATASYNTGFQSFEEAKALVQTLWPQSPGSLKKEPVLTTLADVDEHDPSE